MSFFEILDTIFLKSLELVFEVIYMLAYKITDDFGMSIVVLSLFVSFLLPPLYMCADAVQEEENAIEKKPVYTLRSALSLLLQIPFFIAAYRFLSGLEVLNGVAFGSIPLLGKPDGMLQIGGVIFNVLPIIMTAVNLTTCLIFTKGSSLKSKMQLYGMALFFIVFLYNSSAGLVLYWTLNNVFSLVKTCCYKLKKPGRVFRIQKTSIRENRKAFFTGALFLATLMGAEIPSAVIKSSPQEFVTASYFYHPLWYIAGAFCMAFGIFVFWAGVFYYLSGSSVRAWFETGVWILSGIAVTDYMFFGRNLGLMTAQLQFEKGLSYTWKEIIINMVIVITVAIVLYLLHRKWRRVSAEILVGAMFAVMTMTVVNMVEISGPVNSIHRRDLEGEGEAQFTLSKTGKNVIVLMLDQAMGRYIPYFFQEKPELKEKFDGFTYYANTISHGGYTNFGTPALFGGYEYTPAEMNKRNEKSLAEKHNEALKVMPVLFDGNNYQVTVCDPPYAGYQWTPDLSIYEEYPGIDGYVLKSTYSETFIVEKGIRLNKRNFFCYGILKAVPLCFQKIIYDYGRYNQANGDDDMTALLQNITGIYTAAGLNSNFMNPYNDLCALPDMTKIEDGAGNTFLMMANKTTHEPTMLQEPEYIPAEVVDNTEYEKMNQWRYTVSGNTLRLTENLHFANYQTKMAALLKVGEWLDYMRENDVYDNTRIILVADHGCGSDVYEGGEYLLGGHNLNQFYPLLMVKDFNSRGFKTSEEFMTNADVPTLAMKDLIENPQNPFTGKKIDSSEKTTHVQYVIGSDAWGLGTGNTFPPSIWYSVHDDMRDVDNWKLLSEKETVLPPVEGAE